MFAAPFAIAVLAAHAWPSVSTDVPAFQLGSADAAVVAGVSAPFALPQVAGAAETATDRFTWLTRGRGVPVEHVHLLRNGEVTRERLLSAAGEARQEVGPGGTLWIVFIGHGAPAPSGSDGLLLGVDAQRSELSLRERVGNFAGAVAGAVFVSLPVAMLAQLTDEDRHTLENAQAELAQARNEAERKKLGLPPLQ